MWTLQEHYMPLVEPSVRAAMAAQDDPRAWLIDRYVDACTDLDTAAPGLGGSLAAFDATRAAAQDIPDDVLIDAIVDKVAEHRCATNGHHAFYAGDGDCLTIDFIDADEE